MAIALTDYFEKDHFHALLQTMEKEYGLTLDGMNEVQKLFLIYHLAAILISVVVSRRQTFSQTPRAFTLIDFLSANVPCELFLFAGENADMGQYRISDLADQIGEVSDRKQRLLMIVAIADLLLKSDAEEE
jgi:hypothetical protein